MSDQFCKPGLSFLIDGMDFLIGRVLSLLQDLRIGRLLQTIEDLDIYGRELVLVTPTKGRTQKQMSTLHLHHHSKAKKPLRRLQWLGAELRMYLAIAQRWATSDEMNPERHVICLGCCFCRRNST